ncbi:hypothetical protein KY328_00600 [Candidatus Woesearchaeota archaeon]|nr:hypothetical protein [Candidatus Woesearchaeota archaeon]MBW3021396.1 hypothetical protein [Candidatus Woesearchaeota archaeon]
MPQRIGIKGLNKHLGERVCVYVGDNTISGVLKCNGNYHVDGVFRVEGSGRVWDGEASRVLQGGEIIEIDVVDERVTRFMGGQDVWIVSRPYLVSPKVYSEKR